MLCLSSIIMQNSTSSVSCTCIIYRGAAYHILLRFLHVLLYVELKNKAFAGKTGQNSCKEKSFYFLLFETKLFRFPLLGSQQPRECLDIKKCCDSSYASRRSRLGATHWIVYRINLQIVHQVYFRCNLTSTRGTLWMHAPTVVEKNSLVEKKQKIGNVYYERNGGVRKGAQVYGKMHECVYVDVLWNYLHTRAYIEIEKRYTL